ncbi:hypothetical protein GCM10011415_03050 [Salipiger pallidus]|uniref:Uncharacterized protein n=1 Tax=Salipiger pallidus TaxID=1775170 RepID=A0A8J2ZGI5_9RHOB|nr:hypothetical protein GCM10011415_03050 [Salipiger pallidus]
MQDRGQAVLRQAGRDKHTAVQRGFATSSVHSFLYIQSIAARHGAAASRRTAIAAGAASL